MIDEMDMKLLQLYQKNFPTTVDPYAEIGRQLGLPEKEVLNRYQRLLDQGLVSRIGPVLAHSRLGVSSLVAISIEDAKVTNVADLINGYEEVNHNYLREHLYNLWFVVTARTAERLDEVIAEIEHKSGAVALRLPMIKDFHIDLGFNLWPST